MRIYIQEAVLKTNEDHLPYIKENMKKELMAKIDALNIDEIVSIEDRANCNVYSIEVEFK